MHKKVKCGKAPVTHGGFSLGVGLLGTLICCIFKKMFFYGECLLVWKYKTLKNLS